MKKGLITTKLGKSEVSYNPNTGIILWTRACNKPWLTGRPATHLTTNGYLYIKAGGQMHSASRLAYKLFFKVDLGNLQIDHINRIRTDNRPENLRLVTVKQNLMNRTFRPNKCRVFGVSIHKKSGLYRARYCGKTTYHKTIKLAAIGYARLVEERLSPPAGLTND